MSAGWLILADDLTGAADCAIAFAKQGAAAAVTWGTLFEGEVSVLGVDTESRRLGPEAAAACQVAALKTYWRPGLRLFKKIDSTLRGQPAAELAAQLEAMTGPAAHRAPLAVVAPAFPATGRVTLNGRVIVDGRPLEETGLWALDHTYPNACLPSILADAGLPAATVSLETVRLGAAAVFARLDEIGRQGIGAAVCDCASEDDLLTLAEASLRLDQAVWVGAGGLAAALARTACPSPAAPASPRLAVQGCILFVAGSLAGPSRLQADALFASGRTARVTVTGEALLEGSGGAGWQAAQGRLLADLTAGRDVLLEIAADAKPDLAKGPELANRLAGLVEPAAAKIDALVATGGETACALLNRLGVRGILLKDEMEPGVPLGVSLGGREMTVVTKAGGFGDPGTLLRCLNRLRG